MQIFWFLILVYLSHCSLRLIKTGHQMRENVLPQFLFFIVHVWVMISALLHRPHNVILLPMQLLCTSIIQMITKLCKLEKLRILLYIWLGNVFYFYQVIILLLFIIRNVKFNFLFILLFLGKLE